MPNKIRQLLSLVFILVVPLVARDVLYYLVKLNRTVSTLIAMGLMAVGAFVSFRFLKPVKNKVNKDEE